MTVLIVGATGFIGSRLFQVSQARGATKGTSTSGSENLLRLDLAAPATFDFSQVTAGDVVILTAAISAPDACARDAVRARAVNVGGACHFAGQSIARGARVIFLSSDTVYGEQAVAFDESAQCYPAGDYARMKHEVESRFASEPAFKVARLSYVFARHDKLTQYLTACATKGDEAELFHPFNRAVIWLDDVVGGLVGLATKWDSVPYPVINFAGPAVLSRIDFAQALMARALPGLRYRQVEPPPSFFENRPRVIHMTSRYLRLLLGREPHSLAESIDFAFALKGTK